MTAEWGWPALLGVLGLVFGSFIATVALRWPQGRSALSGRSACDTCGATLRGFELVPVASFALQRGRCRRCGGAIHPAHLVTELVGGAIGLSAGLAAPGVAGVVGAGFGWLLLTLAALDVAALWLPNALTGSLALAGLAVGGWSWFAPSLADRLIGGLAGFAALWLVARAYRATRGRVGLGGGDPKLFGAIGLWLGWQALPNVLLLACALGLAGVLVWHLAGKRVRATDRLPFGVLLAAGAWGWALWQR